MIHSLILARLGVISAMLIAGLATRLLLGLARAGMPNADRVGMNSTVLGFASLLTLAGCRVSCSLWRMSSAALA